MKHEAHFADEITYVTFSIQNRHIMFTGDTQSTVNVWDLGSIDPINKTGDILKLYTINVQKYGPENYINSMVFLDYYGYLLIGCSNGLFVSKIDFLKSNNKTSDFELVASSVFADTFPARERNHLDIHSMGLIGHSMIILKENCKNQLLIIDFGKILMRRCGLQKDMMLRINGCMYFELDTGHNFCMIQSRPCSMSIVIGTQKGDICMYDMSQHLSDNATRNNNLSVKRKKGRQRIYKPNISEGEIVNENIMATPLRVVRWPVLDDSGSINMVDLSSDANFMVSISDSNYISVWRHMIDDNISTSDLQEQIYIPTQEQINTMERKLKPEINNNLNPFNTQTIKNISDLNDQNIINNQFQNDFESSSNYIPNQPIQQNIYNYEIAGTSQTIPNNSAEFQHGYILENETQLNNKSVLPNPQEYAVIEGIWKNIPRSSQEKKNQMTQNKYIY